MKSSKISIIVVQLLITLSILMLIRPIVTYDGWQYISSGNSIFDGSFASNYFFVRQPGYPFFVGICLEIIDSLWFLIFVQIFINVVAVNFFANAVLNLFTFSSESRKRGAKIFAMLTVWLFLGSYPSYVLAQNLFSPFLLFFASLLILDFLKLSEATPRIEIIKWNVLKVLFLSLSFLLAKEIFVICFISYILYVVFTHQVSRITLLVVAISVSMVCVESLVMSHVKDKASSSSLFNQENKEDIFVKNNLFDNLIGRLKIDPPYTQTIFQAALANLDIGPTLGWDGITSSKYEHPGHPARVFALNHILQYGQVCNKFPDEGVIVVDRNYVSKYFNCEPLHVNIPSLFKVPMYAGYLVVWPFLVLFFIYSLINRRRVLLGILPAITIATYSIFGAGISRYGSPVYPIIIVVAIFSLFELLDLKRKRFHQ